jgi:hypothetical protein
MGWQTVALLCALPLALAGGWYLKVWLAPAIAPVTVADVPAAVGDMPAPAPLFPQRPRDEGYIGGAFMVLNDFEIDQLGHYWAGHTYAMTMYNKAAVEAAVEAGNAAMVKPQ